jgi:ClpP class serine protease
VTDENVALVASAVESRLANAASVSELLQAKKDKELAEMIAVASAAHPDKDIVPVVKTPGGTAAASADGVPVQQSSGGLV